MKHSRFFIMMKPYARRAASALHMPEEVILAQWALESAYGNSRIAKKANNYAGIKYTDHADGREGAYAAYNSIGSFVSDYIRVLQLSYYDEVRQADTVKATVAALDRSPYAEDTNYGKKINGIIDSGELPGEKPSYHKPTGNVLKKWDRSELVEVCQKIIDEKADGYFGPKTEKAVKRFQLDKGLKPDGIIGDHTWSAMAAGKPLYFFPELV